MKTIRPELEKVDFIEAYDNVFTPEYCEKVINHFEHRAVLGHAKSRVEREDAPSLYKKDDSMFVGCEREFLELPVIHTEQSLNDEFFDKFFNVAYENYRQKYSILDSCDEHRIYSLKIQRTKPNGGYHVWHAESTTRDTCNRVLAFTVYLNDDFEAGETEFLHQERRVPPKQGTVAIWPAGFTHVHRGNPPIHGTKYIITGWVEF